MCLRRWMWPSAGMRDDELDAAVGGSVDSLAVQFLLYHMNPAYVQCCFRDELQLLMPHGLARFPGGGRRCVSARKTNLARRLAGFRRLSPVCAFCQPKAAAGRTAAASADCRAGVNTNPIRPERIEAAKQMSAIPTSGGAKKRTDNWIEADAKPCTPPTAGSVVWTNADNKTGGAITHATANHFAHRFQISSSFASTA